MEASAFGQSERLEYQAPFRLVAQDERLRVGDNAPENVTLLADGKVAAQWKTQQLGNGLTTVHLPGWPLWWALEKLPVLLGLVLLAMGFRARSTEQALISSLPIALPVALVVGPIVGAFLGGALAGGAEAGVDALRGSVAGADQWGAAGYKAAAGSVDWVVSRFPKSGETPPADQSPTNPPPSRAPADPAPGPGQAEHREEPTPPRS